MWARLYGGRAMCTPSILHLLFLLAGCSSALFPFASATPLALYGRGSSLAASAYESALFAYEASGEWDDFLTTPWAKNISIISASSFTASYVSSGSGDGKKQLIAGAVDFAGSDSIFTTAEYATTPDLVNVPAMAAAVVMIYNIPEIAKLSPTPYLILDRHTLPAIFAGNITMWNDPAILALQDPAVAAVLPSIPIQVVVRSDSSGTSNIFTRVLSSFSHIWSATVGFADLPSWPPALKPVKMALSSGVAAYVAATPYTLGYSPQTDADTLALPYASVINAAGATSRPTTDSITSVIVEQGGSFDSRYTVQLVDSAGASGYPIASYTYFCFRSLFTRTTCEARALLVNFLRWFYNSPTAEVIATRFGFVVLPAVVAAQMIEVVTTKILCPDPVDSSISNPAVVITPVPPNMFSSSLLASPLVRLLTASYQAIDSTYATAVEVKNGVEGVADVLSGKAVGAFVVEAPYDGIELFQSPGESRSFGGNSTTIAYTTPIRLLLHEHPEIGVFPVGVTSLVPVHNVQFNTTLYPLPVPTPSLILDLTTLAKMLIGEIEYWDDETIQLLNPALSLYLPHEEIRPVLFDGASELNSLWRGVLAEEYDPFHESVGEGDDVPYGLRKTHPHLTTVETRLEPLVLAIPNTMAFVQYYPRIIASMIQLQVTPDDPDDGTTTVGASVTARLNISTESMVNCLYPVTSTDVPMVLNPSSTALNPSFNQFSADSYVSYEPKTWEELFVYDVTPTPANIMSCWPFTVAIYAVVPLSYTNTTDDKIESLCETPKCSATRALLEDPAIRLFTDYPKDVDTEPLRLSALAGNGVHGMSTLRFLYWVFSGGLLTRPQYSLGMLPIFESTRNRVRQALNHATIDGQWALTDYPVNFQFASYIRPLSYFLCALGLLIVVALAAVVYFYRSNPVIRASSVPFCFYLLLGSALQYIGLPFLSVSEANGATCMSEVWLISVGFTIAYGSLFLKTLRILFIMKMKKLKVSGLTNTVMTMWLMALVCVLLIVLSAWQGHAPLVGTYSTQTNMTPHVLHHQCGSSVTGVAGTVYLYLVILLMIALMLAATVVSIRIRNVASEFNESKILGLSIYVCLLMLALIVLSALLLWSGQQRDAYTLLFVVGIFLNTSATLGFMLGTKLWIIHEGKDVATTQEPAHTRDVTSSKNRTAKNAAQSSGDKNPSALPPPSSAPAVKSGNWTSSGGSGGSAGSGGDSGQTQPLQVASSGGVEPKRASSQGSQNSTVKKAEHGSFRNARRTTDQGESTSSVPRHGRSSSYRVAPESPANAMSSQSSFDFRRTTSGGEVVLHVRSANASSTTGRYNSATVADVAKVRSLVRQSSNSSAVAAPTVHDEEVAEHPTGHSRNPSQSGIYKIVVPNLADLNSAAARLASDPSSRAPLSPSTTAASSFEITVAPSPTASIRVLESAPLSASPPPEETAISPIAPADPAYGSTAKESAAPVSPSIELQQYPSPSP